jgi:hypothetical protein
MIKLTNILKEVKISLPPKVHNLDKPGVKFENIKVEDTLQFTLYHHQIETVRQKVIGFKQANTPMGNTGDILVSQDLDDYGELRPGKDFWVKFSIENYWKGKPSNIKENLLKEVKIQTSNKPLKKDILDDIKNEINIIVIDYIKDNGDIIKILIDNNDIFENILKPYIVEQMQYSNYEINGNLVRINDDISEEQALDYIESKPNLKQYLIKTTLNYYLESIPYNKLIKLIVEELGEYSRYNDISKFDISRVTENVLENNAGELWDPYIVDTIYKNHEYEDYLFKQLNKSELFENKLLREYPESTIIKLLTKWGIDPNKDKAKAEVARQLINRFDQIKGTLASKLDIIVIPNEIKNKDIKDIDLYSFDDLQKLINSYPENPEKVKKEAVKRFADKFGIDKATAQSYVARFMTKRDTLKFGIRDGIEDLGLTKEDVLNYIPKRLQQKEAFLDPRNWEWESFEQTLDALFPSYKQVVDGEENLAETDADKIYDQNNIEIYKGDDVHKCISYNPVTSQGTKKYGWCVTQKGNTNYDYYRFGETAPTFYFVFDRSKDSSPERAPFKDQWHAFVIQVNKDGNSYVVTGADNRGDIPAKSWEEISKIVPSDTWNKIKNLKDYFKPIPLSAVERGRKFASGKNLSLDEFKELSQDEKILYVQGKASKNGVSKDILEILPKYKINLEGRSTTLANIAIDSGQKIPYNMLKDYESLAKRYAIFRFRHTNYGNDPIPLPYVKYLDDEAKEKYLSKFEDNVSFELLEKYFGKNILEKAVNDQTKELGWIPPNYFKYIKDPKLKSLYEIYSKLYANWNQEDNFNNEEVIETSNDMPEQIVNPILITYDEWKKLSSSEKDTILKLANKVNGNQKYSTFLYAVPYIIKDGAEEYVLLPTSVNMEDYMKYPNWVLVDKNNKIIKNNISGYQSTVGNEELGYGQFSGDDPKRVYSIDDTKLVENTVSETQKLYENWDKYQLMVKAGIIK